MNLKNLSDENLHSETLKTAREERELLTKMLHHLKEIERRRYFAKLKYSSLFEYAVKELKYSEAQALRRISAMRLMRDIPEIEEKIESGSLTLSNLNLAQQMFSKERKVGRIFTLEEKAQVLVSFENQSARQAEKIAGGISPLMKSKTRALEYNMIEDELLRAKLIELKGKFAHSEPNISLEELLHKLCDQALVPKVPSRKSASASSPSTSKVEGEPRSMLKSKAAVLRKVRQRDNRKCTNCDSTYAIEVDHIIPKAVGGETTFENLRLLCRSCNQRAAIEHFGLRKMEPYLNGRRAKQPPNSNFHK